MSFSLKVKSRTAHGAAALAVGEYLKQTAEQPGHDKERHIVSDAIGRLANELPAKLEEEQSVVVEAYGHTACGLGLSGKYDQFMNMDVTIKVSVQDPPANGG